MFFHTYILTRRGPFAKIWLAAHWDRKLTKNDVKVIDLSQAVVQIVEPTVPIALRTSGELMLGVVRVYGHKVRFLLKEAVEVTTDLLRPVPAKLANTHENTFWMQKESAPIVHLGGMEKSTTGGASAPNGPSRGRAMEGTSVAMSSVTQLECTYQDLLNGSHAATSVLGGQFDDIADFVLGTSDDFFSTLLQHPGARGTGKNVHGKRIRDETNTEMLHAAWFVPQMAQQHETLESIRDFSGIEGGDGHPYPAGVHREGSQPNSEHSKKSGTSSSKSIEQLRASTLAGSHSHQRGSAGGDVDLLMELPPVSAMDGLMFDGLDVPGLMLTGEANPILGDAPREEDGVDRALFLPGGDADALMQGLPPLIPEAKKPKVSLNVVDAASTTIPAEAYHRVMRDYSEQLAPRRHGARTEDDIQHLKILLDQGLGKKSPGALPTCVRNGCSAEAWPMMDGVFNDIAQTLKQRFRSIRVHSESSAWAIEAPRASAHESIAFDHSNRGASFANPDLTEGNPFEPGMMELPDWVPLPDTNLAEHSPLEPATDLAPLPSFTSNRERLDALEKLLRANSNRAKVAVFRASMKGQRRAAVAQAFGDILTLATLERVKLKQDAPYGEIRVTFA